MNQSLILPLIIPMLTAIATILARGQRRVLRWLSLLGALALLGATLALLISVDRDGIQVAQIGNWPAPFGITLVIDLYSAIMLVMAGLIGLIVAVYSLASIDEAREMHGYHTLFHVLLMGVCGAFLTGDIFNLYVWFEVMLVASFVLLALGGERAQLEGAIKYVTLNLISSAIFLAAVGILYSVTGTLNMADLSRQILYVTQPGLVTTVATLFMISFGIKAAMFPLFFWLPASYHTPPAPVAAIFAGLLTKVGVYALTRTFTLIFVQDVSYTHAVILIFAGLTMLTGVLGAVAQTSVRRILSFNLVSHIGYMLMGLGLFTPLALAGAIFYTVHHMIVKTNLFLISGILERLQGSDELTKLGGLYANLPGLAVLFLVSAFSLSGIPPLSGFWAKLTLIRAGLDAKQFIIVAIALAASLLTLYTMTRIWDEAFWKPAPAGAEVGPTAQILRGARSAAWLGPVAVLAMLTTMIGLVAEPILALSMRAAEQLLNPALYVQAVLGG